MKQWIPLLCLVVCVSAGAIFSKTLKKPYTIEKTWVQNFIKFQYVFEGKQKEAKIVPLGCVPSNTNGGRLLKPDEKIIGHDFVFACEQGEDGILSYEAIGCVDGNGELMQIGELRSLINGTVILHCNIFGGAVRKVVEKASGCFYNNTIYHQDQRWVEKIDDDYKSHSTDQNSYPMDGRLMQCFRPHYSYYESHVVGCASGRVAIRIGEMAEVSRNKFVKCVASEKDHTELVEIQTNDLNCHFENNTFLHDAIWIDEERAAELSCRFGHVTKIGCILSGSKVPIGQEIKISLGCVFLCHPQTNVYLCNKKLGDYTVIEGDIEENEDKRFPFGTSIDNVLS